MIGCDIGTPYITVTSAGDHVTVVLRPLAAGSQVIEQPLVAPHSYVTGPAAGRV